MRKILLTAALATITTAMAELPLDLQPQVTDTDAKAFFLAMDQVEREFPDATSEVTYDTYPDGVKIITRRIDLPMIGEDAKLMNKLSNYICNVFDSITATPDANRMVVNNFRGETMNRVYKIKSDPYDNTVNMSDLTDISSSAAAAVVIQNNVLTIAQSWTITTDKRLGAPNLTALIRVIQRLVDDKDAKKVTTHDDYSNPSSNGVRIRKNREPVTDHVEVEQITLHNTNVSNWINLHHQFMAYLGANANISLTYWRNERMVTLTDYDNKTIYAAKYTASAIPRNGSLYIATAKYSGQQPYLPVNWWKTKIHIR